MIIDGPLKQNVYQQILKAANRRLEQAIPGSEGAYAHLSLGSVLIIILPKRRVGFDWRFCDHTHGPSSTRRRWFAVGRPSESITWSRRPDTVAMVLSLRSWPGLMD